MPDAELVIANEICAFWVVGAMISVVVSLDNFSTSMYWIVALCILKLKFSWIDMLAFICFCISVMIYIYPSSSEQTLVIKNIYIGWYFSMLSQLCGGINSNYHF